MNRFLLVALLALATTATPVQALQSPTPAPSAAGAGRPPDVMRLAAENSPLIEQARPAPTRAQNASRQPQGARQSASTPKVSKQVFGYVNAGNLGSSSVGYTSWNFQDLTTVAFFGLHVDSGGNLLHDSSYSVWTSTTTTNFINTAHNAGVKIVVSIIQQDQATMCSSLQHAVTTAQQTYNENVWHGIDGVNIDYEGGQAACGGSNMSTALDGLAQQLRSYLPAPRQVSIATYASAAEYAGGFFDIPGLNQFVDSFFVMAYDMDNGNYNQAPLNCSSFCLSPTAPLTTYGYNDTRAVQHFVNVVAASKVILGVPYYGYTACTAPISAGRPGPNANSSSTPSWTAPTYLDSTTTNGYTGVSNWAEARDTHDSAGQEPYSTWQSSTYNCWRESYWDDATSLGAKYDLINQYGIAGAGLFALDYGGGASELWNAIATHLTCPTGLSSPASVSSTQWQITVTPTASCTASIDVQAYDQTLNEGWFDVFANQSPQTSSLTVNGYQGHTYLFRARAHDIYGQTDAWSTPAASTQVASTATEAHAFAGLYSIDAYGGVNPADSPPLGGGGYWAGWKIVRSATVQPGTSSPQGGYVLDGYGGVHNYGVAPPASISAFWPNWDIARDLAMLPDGSGGYVLDGFGGLHPFAASGHSMPPAASGFAYWPNWDIARKLVMLPSGTGGYVLDGWGALHPFAVGSNPLPPQPTGFAYWQNWDIARGLVLIPGTTMGYTLDGYGGVHPFNGAPSLGLTSYWPNWDIARAIWLTAGSTPASPQGLVLDGYGGLHPLNGLAQPVQYAYTPGSDTARALIGS